MTLVGSLTLLLKRLVRRRFRLSLNPFPGGEVCRTGPRTVEPEIEPAFQGGHGRPGCFHQIQAPPAFAIVTSARKRSWSVTRPKARPPGWSSTTTMSEVDSMSLSCNSRMV
jgi:hypothetical protein